MGGAEGPESDVCEHGIGEYLLAVVGGVGRYVGDGVEVREVDGFGMGLGSCAIGARGYKQEGMEGRGRSAPLRYRRQRGTISHIFPAIPNEAKTDIMLLITTISATSADVSLPLLPWLPICYFLT